MIAQDYTARTLASSAAREPVSNRIIAHHNPFM